MLLLFFSVGNTLAIIIAFKNPLSFCLCYGEKQILPVWKFLDFILLFRSSFDCVLLLLLGEVVSSDSEGGVLGAGMVRELLPESSASLVSLS